MDNSLATVVLAAGLGTRMKSERAKVLHAVAGRPMIEYPVGLARALHSGRVICVLGHQAEAVQSAIEARYGAGSVEVAIQAEQKGTGHALQQAAPLLAGHEGLLLILSGDVPLMKQATLERLVQAASSERLALVTFTPADPKGLGRIVRGQDGAVQRIVEEKDASEAQRALGEVNAGLYCGPARFMLEALHSLTANNAQGELYLTDIVERAARALSVTTVEATAEEVMGINNRVELGRADRIMRLRLAEALMLDGVTVRDPERLHIEPGVSVGRDSELGPGVELRGRTSVGIGCRLDAGVILTDTIVGDQVHIKPYCVATESQIGDRTQVGPWAHLRPGSVLESDVHLGNFVETKKTRLGKGAKANHLSYLGDADIGEKVNIGCGTITCNYDGYKKYRTVIEAGAFVGSDTQLVAPVSVGERAVIAAGTTVFENVPAGALALTRTAQVNVPGYYERKKQQMEKQVKNEEPSPTPHPRKSARP